MAHTVPTVGCTVPSLTHLFFFFFSLSLSLLRGQALDPTSVAMLEATANVSSVVVPGMPEVGGSGEEGVKETFTWLAYGLACVTFVYVTVIIFMRKNIKIAVAVIKESSKAVGHMPLIVTFPLTTLLAVIAMFGYWVWTFGNCYTMGEVVAADLTSAASSVVATGDNYTTAISEYAASPVRDYILWYLIFALFWMNSFLQGIAQMTICGAFASWYWTETDADTGSKSNMYKYVSQKAHDIYIYICTSKSPCSM